MEPWNDIVHSCKVIPFELSLYFEVNLLTSGIPYILSQLGFSHIYVPFPPVFYSTKKMLFRLLEKKKETLMVSPTSGSCMLEY